MKKLTATYLFASIPVVSLLLVSATNGISLLFPWVAVGLFMLLNRKENSGI